MVRDQTDSTRKNSGRTVGLTINQHYDTVVAIWYTWARREARLLLCPQWNLGRSIDAARTDLCDHGHAVWPAVQRVTVRHWRGWQRKHFFFRCEPCDVHIPIDGSATEIKPIVCQPF
jgi:hypothetical protein